MFSSPARPTPRRGLRMRESLSRSAFDNASVQTRSRLGSVRQLSPASSGGESTRTVRHQDNDEVYWSRDERHSVISNGPLPSEVSNLVNDPDFDFIVEGATGQIDSGSGFALVSTPTRCFAWNYAKKTHSSPTVYTFPTPIPTRSHMPNIPPALAAFYGARAAEPGLVLVSATGEVRLWESMSLALANVQRFQSIELPLASDDFAEHIYRLDDANFVVTTTSSAAFRLSVVNHGGRLVPTAQPFTRPGGLFNRASPIIFDSSERNGIVAVAPVQGGVCLLGRSTLQAWEIGPDGYAKLVHEFNLHDAIGSSLFDDDAIWQSGNLHVELNDLVATGPGQFATLVSYSRNSGTSDHSRSHNSHAIVLFDFNASTNTVTIDKIVHISYLAHSDPRMLDVPRLYVPNGTKMAFVHFADAIVMASLSNIPYEDTVRLRDSKNLFLGAGNGRSGASLVAMARLGGIMTIDVYAGSAQAPKLSSAASATAGLKTKIEQTVFFGDRSNNPLTFNLPPGFKGDLAEAAEAVSTEIVSSSSPYLPTIYEVRPQLTDRRSRLGALMQFIHANGVLSLIPQDSRRRLESHAEKIKAAIDLWDHQNRLMDKLNTRSPQSLLADSIQILMNQLGVGAGDEDVVRLFFRTQVLRLDRLLEIVFQTFQAATQAAGQGADLSEWILEANRIFITALRSATQVRDADTTVYQVDRERPSIELWTASDAIIDDLDALYSATQRLIKDRTRQMGSVVDEPAPQNADSKLARQQRDQATLKMQMAQLAAALCENMEDKLRTNATLQLNGVADATEGLALAKRWDDLKPRIIRPLVDIDRVSEAYALAEHHRDFPTLVYLTHNPASSEGPARIEMYIEKYGQDFAFVLYQWYIDQGRLYDLLSQDEVYGRLLSAFFAKHPHPELSWIHSIAIKDYGGAATALQAVEEDTASLAQKHLQASLGKLAAVADAKARGQTTQIEELDDSLDLINTENALREYINEVAPGSGHPKKANPKKYVADVKLQYPAFEQVLERQVGALLDGDALDVEGLVDVLTLTLGRNDDAAIALERLAHAPLPEGRKQVALISTWRRVYTHDDWANLTKTAGRSEEAQRNLQRQTATYRTLRALKELPDQLPASFTSMSPKIAAQPPLMVEIKARFPELPNSAHEALMADHEAEIAELEKGVSNGLAEGVKAITELVESDIQQDAEGDVSM